MLLDLREIIDVPGGKVSFDYEPDMKDIIGGSVIRVEEPVRATGKVTNSAGVLTFTADADIVCTCACARCLKEFEYPIHKLISVNLTEGGVGENPDGYFLQGDKIDATEIIVTETILGIDDRLLCSEDCAGLCQKCGVNLNEGKCDCKRDIDPRLEILSQLLEE
ncbi:MAG: DUF177 domain-containing protein [Oscillospiraceae bacterium]|nr:DUF177 domain-containing protein [Oscillospiraceae bacterium]